MAFLGWHEFVSEFTWPGRHSNVWKSDQPLTIRDLLMIQALNHRKNWEKIAKTDFITHRFKHISVRNLLVSGMMSYFSAKTPPPSETTKICGSRKKTSMNVYGWITPGKFRPSRKNGSMERKPSHCRLSLPPSLKIWKIQGCQGDSRWPFHPPSWRSLNLLTF